ncbi:M20 family metallopeptidase [Chitinophagales bacterium]|nr:M20 family metallopeptidase [Chitinophagales bacterium]
MIDRIKKITQQSHKEVVAFRRHLHAHPELSFEEKETANYIHKQLEKWGILFERNIAGHGTVAYVKGALPSDAVIALRADIDALPITEANEVPYKSTNEGTMHACGHDVHTANLLGTIKVLQELRDSFGGTIKCFFQPAEERFPGGASLMIKDGVLENPKPASILGQHVHPPLAVGKVGFCAGMAMASADEIYLTVKGKGGHAAQPQMLIDPVLVSAHLLTALQQVVSRRVNPLLPTVLSFGKINSEGGATNVIPNQVAIEGTFRSLDEDWRFEAHKHIQDICEGVAHAMGATVDLEIRVGYPSLYNNVALTERTMNAAKVFLGEDRVEEIPIRMGAEDFAYYSQVMDGCFYRLGIRNEDLGITSGLHTPTFNVDEAALETGVGLMSYLAIQELAFKTA